MARIPLGNFDQVAVSPQVGRSNLDQSGVTQGARAMEAAGQTLAAIGERGLQMQDAKLRQEQAQRDQEAEALLRVKAANALADRRIQVAAAQQDYATRMAAGDVDYRTADAGWGETVAKLPAPQAPEGMDPALQETFNGGLRQIDEEARLKVTGLAQVAMRADFKAQAVAATEKNEQLAATTGDTETAVRNNAALATVWRAAGFDEAQTAKALADSNARIYGNEVKGRMLAGRDSVEQLQALQSDLTGAKGKYLDKLPADTRLALAESVATDLDQLQRAQQTAADKRETVAAGVVKDAIAQAAAGIPPTPDTVEAWAKSVQGTTQEAPFREAMGTIREVQTVRRLPGPQQQAWLQAQETKLNTEGGSPQDLTRLNTVRAALARDAEQRENAPLLYLQNMTGKAPAALDMTALQGGDVGAFGAVLADRMASVETLRRQGYAAKLNLLLPNEAEALTSAVKQMPPEQLLKLFGPLRAASGSETAYNAVMQQIAPGAPLKAYAGELAVRPGGQPAAALLLRGDALLNPKDGKPWAMPPGSAFEQAFTDTVGDAYQGRPDALQRDLAAARAVYAGSAAQDGDTLAGTEFDAERFAGAMRAVMGDVAEIGGVRAPAPWGMDADTFADQAAPQMRQALQAAGLDPEASGVGLMATPQPGRYVLVQGRSPVWNPAVKRADGRPMPVYIDFAPAPPEAPTRHVHTAAYEATVRGTR